MKRSTAISALVVLVAAARPALAQTPVGVILGTDAAYTRAVAASFEAELEKHGVTPQILVQRPAAQRMAWTNTARKFAAFDVQLVLVVGAPIGISCITADIEVPIIIACPHTEAPDRSSARMTGAIWHVPVGSVVGYLKQIRDFKKLGVIVADDSKATRRIAAELDRLASKHGYTPTTIMINSATDAQRLGEVDAAFITPSCAYSSCLADVVAVAREKAVPTATSAAGSEDQGVLLTLEADPIELGQEVGKIAIRLLNGDAPASIPLVTSKKIAMIVNLKEAGAMGIKVPFEVLGAASRIIK